jgi:hypothetical protein
MLQITAEVTRRSNSDMSVLMEHFNTRTNNNNIKGNTGTFDEVINSNNEGKLNEILNYTII